MKAAPTNEADVKENEADVKENEVVAKDNVAVERAKPVDAPADLRHKVVTADRADLRHKVVTANRADLQRPKNSWNTP